MMESWNKAGRERKREERGGTREDREGAKGMVER